MWGCVGSAQIKEEDEGEEQSGHTHGHADQDLRHIYARSNVTQDSVKALIAMHKNLPDEVGAGARVSCEEDRRTRHARATAGCVSLACASDAREKPTSGRWTTSDVQEHDHDLLHDCVWPPCASRGQQSQLLV